MLSALLCPNPADTGALRCTAACIGRGDAEVERLCAGLIERDHDDLFDQPDTRDRITPASVNRALEGTPPPRPGQLAFILRAAHMDVSRVQGSEDA